MTSYEKEELQLRANVWKWVGITIGIIVITIAALMVVIPPYRVWSSEMKGKAEYMRAEQNRRIRVEEAKANLDA